MAPNAGREISEPLRREELEYFERERGSALCCMVAEAIGRESEWR